MRVSVAFISIAVAVTAQNTYTATGVGCEPHDDHWHCPAGVAEPTTDPVAESSIDTVSATASGVCEPHDDHWHCPSGVAEPTYAPSAVSAFTSAVSGAVTAAPSVTASHSHDDHDDQDDHSHAVTASTCEPHNDHWHCPSGVAEPTTAPAQIQSTSGVSTASSAGASGSTNASSTQLAGAGSTVNASQQSIIAVVLGAFGALFL